MKPQFQKLRLGLSWRTAAPLTACALGGIVVLAGCGPSLFGAPPCMPPSYFVSPSSAAIGETVTIEAQDSDCDPRYGENAEVNVTVTDAGGKKIISTTAPMNDAGGFIYSFQLPTNATLGEAAVEAYPHNVDWCDDTGKNNRVSDAEKSFIRASCAARIEPLLVTDPE